jgi:hypothetical protein
MSSSDGVRRTLRPRAATPAAQTKVNETFASPSEQAKRTKTSLALDDQLYRNIRMLAVERGVPPRDLIEAGMRYILSGTAYAPDEGTM